MAAGDGVPVVVRGWPWPRRVCGKEIRRAIRAHRRAGRVRGTGCSASRLQHVCEFRCAVGAGQKTSRHTRLPDYTLTPSKPDFGLLAAEDFFFFLFCP